MPEYISVPNSTSATIIRTAVDANTTDTITATMSVTLVNEAAPGSQPAWISMASTDLGVVDNRKTLECAITVDVPAAAAAGANNVTFEITATDGTNSTTREYLATINPAGGGAGSGGANFLYVNGPDIYRCSLNDPQTRLHSIHDLGYADYCYTGAIDEAAGLYFMGDTRQTSSWDNYITRYDIKAGTHLQGPNTARQQWRTPFVLDKAAQKVYFAEIGGSWNRMNYDFTSVEVISPTPPTANSAFYDPDTGLLHHANTQEIRTSSLGDPSAYTLVKDLGTTIRALMYDKANNVYWATTGTSGYYAGTLMKYDVATDTTASWTVGHAVDQGPHAAVLDPGPQKIYLGTTYYTGSSGNYGIFVFDIATETLTPFLPFHTSPKNLALHY